VDQETTLARNQVGDIEAAFMQLQEYMTNAEKAGLTTRKYKKALQTMMNDIEDNQNNLWSVDDVDGRTADDDGEADTELVKLSLVDEPSWVRGTISNTVQQVIKISWKKTIMLHKLAQP
jgi:hypothetical protein